MKNGKLNKEEITELIFFACKENSVDIKNITSNQIDAIIKNYYMFCEQFSMYVIGELDTFKRASCLLVAIDRSKICEDKYIKASIALDAAYKMCEKPYWYEGEKSDIPKKLEEVDYKKLCERQPEFYMTSKNLLIDSLVYQKAVPLNYNLNLQLFYEVALQIKHMDSVLEAQEISEKSKRKSFINNLIKRGLK